MGYDFEEARNIRAEIKILSCHILYLKDGWNNSRVDQVFYG
jgi:hypothetical protein